MFFYHSTPCELKVFNRWDKNNPPKDCPYSIFGKRMQRSIMGFGSLTTAFYSHEMISEAALNESHGTSNPGKSNMRYFHQRLAFHKYVVYHEPNMHY